jgi:hypothetical protein
MSEFTEEEIEILNKELNDLSPEFMVWSPDGHYEACLALKAKNYVLKEKGTNKISIKGSAFKDQKKEPVMRQMLKELSLSMIEDDINYLNLTTIYDKYANEVISGVKDIKPWCSKKTITEKILKCAGHEKLTPAQKKEKKIRKNETDVWDAVKGQHIQEGDKIYVFPVVLPDEIITGRISEKTGKPMKDQIKKRNGLKSAIQWQPGEENKKKLLSRIYATVKICDTVLDISQFKNYAKEQE